jgi:hypothetical protein
VTYSGSGFWRTTYHAQPPSDLADPTGPHDTNDANDSSTQRWALKFAHLLSVGGCPAGQCRAPRLPAQATGRELITGKVAHTHVDGIYAADDQSVSCSVRSKLPSDATARARVRLRRVPGANAIAITAFIPTAQALNLLPTLCPEQTDSLDGLYNNYFTPGFSFAPGYGPTRWFTSGTVVIPVPVLHRSERITLRLHNVARNTPPRNCAVAHPQYEQCVTGGSWAGSLELTSAS